MHPDCLGFLITDCITSASTYMVYVYRVDGANFFKKNYQNTFQNMTRAWDFPSAIQGHLHFQFSS